MNERHCDVLVWRDRAWRWVKPLPEGSSLSAPSAVHVSAPHDFNDPMCLSPYRGSDDSEPSEST